MPDRGSSLLILQSICRSHLVKPVCLWYHLWAIIHGKEIKPGLHTLEREKALINGVGVCVCVCVISEVRCNFSPSCLDECWGCFRLRKTALKVGNGVEMEVNASKKKKMDKHWKEFHWRERCFLSRCSAPMGFSLPRPLFLLTTHSHKESVVFAKDCALCVSSHLNKNRVNARIPYTYTHKHHNVSSLTLCYIFSKLMLTNTLISSIFGSLTKLLLSLYPPLSLLSFPLLRVRLTLTLLYHSEWDTFNKPSYILYT